MNEHLARRCAPGPVLLWLAVFSLLSGCASLQQSVETPEISLTGLRLVEVGLSRQRYDLTLHVVNPNPIPLPIRGLSYRVQLAGERFAEGETARAFTVPASGATDFELAVTTDLLRTFTTLQRLLGEGEQTLEYELGGQLQVDLPFVRALPFSSSGAIDLVRPMRF